nr:nucleolin-like [Coffea arabica]
MTFDESNGDISKSCGKDDDADVQEGLKKLTINDLDTASPENDSKEDDSQDSPALEDNDKNRSITEEYPVSGSEKELEQSTNAHACVTKTPRNVTESHNKKGKRSSKRKGIAQTKERQTATPSVEQSEKQQAAEKNAGEQQTAEPSTKKSPRTSSGVQNTVSTDQRSGKRKRPAKEQPEAQIAEEPTPYPSSLIMMPRRGSNGSRRKASSLRGLSSHTNFDNENAHQKEPRTKPTTETTPEYRASSSQPQDKGKTPATEKETEEDDDEDTEEEEVHPAQFGLARRRPGSSKITI